MVQITKPILKDRTIPDRNGPCSCYSGKKYKKCCLPADAKKAAYDMEFLRSHKKFQ